MSLISIKAQMTFPDLLLGRTSCVPRRPTATHRGLSGRLSSRDSAGSQTEERVRTGPAELLDAVGEIDADAAGRKAQSQALAGRSTTIATSFAPGLTALMASRRSLVFFTVRPL